MSNHCRLMKNNNFTKNDERKLDSNFDYKIINSFCHHHRRRRFKLFSLIIVVVVENLTISKLLYYH